MTEREVLHKRAVALRRHATLPERLIWAQLRDRRFRGLKFRRQVPIGGYIADFACHELLLIVELDGGQHADSGYDVQRDARLKALGWRVLRMWNAQVREDVAGALARIGDFIDTCPHPPTR